MVDSLVVIGGTGNVGRGIVAAALGRGWQLTGVDQDDSRSGVLAEEQGGAKTVVGSVADADQAADSAARLDLSSVDAVVVAVNVPWAPTPVLSTTWEQVQAHLDPYLRLHYTATTTLVPAMRAGAVLLGMGGGKVNRVVRRTVCARDRLRRCSCSSRPPRRSGPTPWLSWWDGRTRTGRQGRAGTGQPRRTGCCASCSRS